MIAKRIEDLEKLVLFIANETLDYKACQQLMAATNYGFCMDCHKIIHNSELYGTGSAGFRCYSCKKAWAKK